MIDIKFEHKWSFSITYEEACKRDGVYESDGREPGGCKKYVFSGGEVVCCMDYLQEEKRTVLMPLAFPHPKLVFAEGGLREMDGHKIIITIG